MRTALFVCVGNSARSQMAEGFFNLLAPFGWRAKSAGTSPASSISREAVAVMKEKGIDISKNKPKTLTQDMLGKADHVISMGCGIDLCPYNLYKNIVDWGIEDPAGQPVDNFRKVRDEIEEKVRRLVEEITASTQ